MPAITLKNKLHSAKAINPNQTLKCVIPHPLDAMLLIASAVCVNGEIFVNVRTQLGIPSTGHIIPLNNKLGNTVAIAISSTCISLSEIEEIASP